jgi:hypothetical protein
MPLTLAILFEHPDWFTPLFAALDRRGIAFVKIALGDHSFDPSQSIPPAPLVLSRVAMSGFLRDPEHGIFYASALLDHWRRCGAQIINGPDTLAIDSSKARQLSLITALGHRIPATRIVHRARDLVAASQGMSWPLLVKANIGGSGAGIARFSSPDELAQAVADGSVPTSIDQVLLLQDYVPPRGGTIMRVETLGGRFLYALEVESSGDSFDLCPADACLVRPGHTAIAMRAVTPPAEIIAAAEAIAERAGLDVGSVELVIDDRDGVARFYDINALSNFVAKPLEILGYDPHERLVDYLQQSLARESI